MAGRGKFSEGAAVDKAWASSVVPCLLKASVGSTSTGAKVSRRERSATRVPVTTTSLMSSSLSVDCAAARLVPIALDANNQEIQQRNRGRGE